MQEELNKNRELRKEKHQEIAREAIISAAMTTFAKLGFEKTSMRNVAAEAGYGAASLYSYFKSKEEILSEVAERSLNAIEKLYETTVPPQDFSFQDKILYMLESDMMLLKSLPHMAQLRQANLTPDKIKVVRNNIETTVLQEVTKFIGHWMSKHIPKEERFYVETGVCATYLVSLMVPIMPQISFQISKDTASSSKGMSWAKQIAKERICFFAGGIEALSKALPENQR